MLTFSVSFTHSLGTFQGDDDLNLIIARVNRLEIHVVSQEGLRAVQEVNVFGKISEVQLVRARGEVNIHKKSLYLYFTRKMSVQTISRVNLFFRSVSGQRCRGDREVRHGCDRLSRRKSG